jgi:hypothetical protein
LGVLLPGSTFKKFHLQFQFWFRDLAIRRNMMTSCCIDVTNIVEGNDASILDPKGGDVTADEICAMMAFSSTNALEAAAFRWDVVIGGSSRACQQLRPGSPEPSV